MRRYSLLVCLLLFCLTAGSVAANETISQIRTGELSKQQFFDLFRLGLDVIHRTGDQFDILVKTDDMARLDAMGIPYEITRADVEQWYSSVRGKAAVTMGGFRTLSEIEAHLDSLHALYPSICTEKYSIGTSFQGRNLWVVKISDNPDVDEDEPEVFYNSLIHAREPAGMASVLYFMDYLLENYGVDSLATYIVDNRELFFMPVVNPDGYYANEQSNPYGGGMWRKNMRYDGNSLGVDLNRNFGYMWGYDDIGSSPNPTSETYRGPGPFSEPETQAMRDFSIQRHFVIVHNFHTYSNLFLWPWGYDRFYTDREDFFRTLGDSATRDNGYTPVVGWGLYPTNGATDDWYWGDTISKPRTISVTTEVGGDQDGFWPAPYRIPDLVQENLWPNLFLAKIADNPYRLSPPNRPVLFAPDSSTGDYSVSWHTSDTINTITGYRLFELQDRQTVTDDAEADNGYWDTQLFTRSMYRRHSGVESWAAQQQSSSQHYLQSITPYTVGENDSLVCWMWYAIESGYDYLYAQVSTDGGTEFYNLAGNVTTNDDPNGANMGNGITGSSTDWVRTVFDLSAYAGQSVLIRFNYVTDSYLEGAGVFIDDIENVDVFGSTIELVSGTPDTSIAFVEKPEGDYWYRAVAVDSDDQESRFSNMKHVLVDYGWVLGDCNDDGDVNLADITFLVGSVYLGAADPVPLERGDLDCSGSLMLNDITIMIDHVYLTHKALGCQ